MIIKPVNYREHHRSSLVWPFFECTAIMVHGISRIMYLRKGQAVAHVKIIGSLRKRSWEVVAD